MQLQLFGRSEGQGQNKARTFLASCMIVFYLLFFCAQTIDASIIVLNANNVENATFEDIVIRLGPNRTESVRGHLSIAEPRNGCSKMKYPPNIRDKKHSNVTWYGWIALIERGDCYFDDKIFNAYNAHFVAIIVYNSDSDILGKVRPHLPVKDGQARLPAVLIGKASANYLMMFKNSAQYTVVVFMEASSRFSSDIMLPFLIVMGLCLLLMIALLVAKWAQGVRRNRKSRLSKQHLRKIPIRKFVKGEKYDVCAICLDEYEEGEKIRVLPCEHAYHVKCIDHWLTKRKRTCPICKRKLFAKEDGDESSSGSESDAEARSETAPLLGSQTDRRRRPQRPGGTFDDNHLPAILYHDDDSSDESSSDDDDASNRGANFYQSSVEVHDSRAGLGNSLFYSAESAEVDGDAAGPTVIVDPQRNSTIQAHDDAVAVNT